MADALATFTIEGIRELVEEMEAELRSLQSRLSWRPPSYQTKQRNVACWHETDQSAGPKDVCS